MTLLFASTLLALGGAEVLLRLIEGEPLSRLAVRAQKTPSPARQVTLEEAATAAAQVPLARAMDPSWFGETPPGLSNRRPVAPELLALEEQIRGRDMSNFDMYKAWNGRILRDELCSRTDNDFFKAFPGFAWVFEPVDGRPHPRFRYLPSTTTPAGLVTNRFGFRGEEIPFLKGAGTVRIAFLGASTTVDVHSAPHAYPDYVIHWLNLWAHERRPGIRFEGLNAGREGITSEDISAIMCQEVAPLEPDMVVYYEGANEFNFRPLLRGVESGQADADRRGVRRLRAEPRWLAYSALARRAWPLLRALSGQKGAEPRKPRYTIAWPAGLDENDPDLGYAPLPLALSSILRNLDDSRRASSDVGGTLVLTSFVWSVWDGMVLDPHRHPNAETFFQYLNTGLWPCRYKDLRRFADFQNRVLRKYASVNGLPFIDVAGMFPRDPRFFFDPIHNLPEGSRLRAWIVLQGLLPLIEAQLNSGALPRPARANSARHPALEGPSPRRLPFDEVRRSCGGSARAAPP